MKTSVAVRERVYVDEPERGGGGLQHGIDAIVAHTVVGFEQARHQVVEALRAGADELRERIARVVAVAYEDAGRAQTGLYKTRVFDQDAVEVNDLIEGERVPSCLQHGAAPALQTVARWSLALDVKARAAVGQEHEAGRAGDEVPARLAHCATRAHGKGERRKSLQGPLAPDYRTKPAGAEQVVPHPMAPRKARPARE